VDTGTGASRRVAITALLAFLALTAAAWPASDAPLRMDDFTYMLLALLHRDEWLTWLDSRAWFGHFRPLFYLSWWSLGPLSIDGSAVRLAQVVVWAGGVTAIGLAGWRRRGLAGVWVVVLALPLNPVFLELLLWKSWLTTVGTLAGLGIGAVEMARDRPRWPVVAAAGILALGFKETGPFALGALALLEGRGAVRWIGAALVAGALAAAVPAAEKLVLDQAPRHALRQVANLAPMSWLVPVAVALRLPRAPWYALAAAAGVALLPDPLRGPAALAAVVFLAWPHPAWLATAAAAWALACVGPDAPPHYLLEGWTVLVVLLATRVELPRRWDLGLVALVAALWFTPRYADVYQERHPVAVEQRAFLASFHPEPARGLFIPPGGYRIDLDVLVWVDLGVEFLVDAPGNARPVRVGPLSGIWADIEPVDPDLPMRPGPPRGPAIRKLPPGSRPTHPGRRPRVDAP